MASACAVISEEGATGFMLTIPLPLPLTTLFDAAACGGKFTCFLFLDSSDADAGNERISTGAGISVTTMGTGD
jgi:hypothetical protein